MSIRKRLQLFFNTDSEFRPIMPAILEHCGGEESLLEDALSIICEEEQRAARDLSVIDNSFQMLRDVKRIPGISVMLVTLQCGRVVHQIIEDYDLSDIFASVTSRDEESERFAQIRDVINGNDLLPSKTLVIGDRRNDVISADRLGCRSILFNDSGNEILDVPKDTIHIRDYSRLVTIVKQL